MVGKTWKEVLSDQIPAELGDEIDVFETQIELRRQEKLDEKIFAETRLRRGVYGQLPYELPLSWTAFENAVREAPKREGEDR